MRAFSIAFVALLAPAACFAQSSHQTAQGTRLKVGLPCAKEISIVADPSLSGQVVLNAEAAHQEEIDQMQFSGGDAVKLKMRGVFSMGQGWLASLHGACWHPENGQDFEPTLKIKLSVPAGFPTSIDASSDGDIHVDIGGPLDVDLSGSARLDATAVSALNLDVSGSGKADFRKVVGPIHLALSGSGDVSVAQATSPSVAIDVSGSGSFKIGGGAVGKVAVNSSGSGEIVLGATVDDAAVESSGSGSVTFARLAHLAQNTSGSGEVVVKEK